MPIATGKISGSRGRFHASFTIDNSTYTFTGGCHSATFKCDDATLWYDNKEQLVGQRAFDGSLAETVELRIGNIRGPVISGDLEEAVDGKSLNGGGFWSSA
jgi:hypothetical protein